MLVSTTVVEVGVDVPNASVMLVEHAERFGLSQLHQLRGRVGRGAHPSFCVLLYQSPLTDQGRERLKALTETTDGFVIAERDLELRGPGDFFGTRQSGMPTLRVGDLLRDHQLMEEARREAVAALDDVRQAGDAGGARPIELGAAVRVGRGRIVGSRTSRQSASRSVAQSVVGSRAQSGVASPGMWIRDPPGSASAKSREPSAEPGTGTWNREPGPEPGILEPGTWNLPAVHHHHAHHRRGAERDGRIDTPSWDGLRPTSDRLRETLFNVLAPRHAGRALPRCVCRDRGGRHRGDEPGGGRRDLRRAGPRGLPSSSRRTCAAAGCRTAMLLSALALRARSAGLSRSTFDIIFLDPPYGAGCARECARCRRAADVGSGTLLVDRARPAGRAPPGRAGACSGPAC